MYSEALDSVTEEKDYRTDSLFSTPSFWNGLGSVFNIRGGYYLFNYSDSPQAADKRAIESDWGMIGADFRRVIRALLEAE